MSPVLWCEFLFAALSPDLEQGQTCNRGLSTCLENAGGSTVTLRVSSKPTMTCCSCSSDYYLLMCLLPLCSSLAHCFPAPPIFTCQAPIYFPATAFAVPSSQTLSPELCRPLIATAAVSSVGVVITIVSFYSPDLPEHLPFAPQSFETTIICVIAIVSTTEGFFLSHVSFPLEPHTELGPQEALVIWAWVSALSAVTE